ncbi:hypothetical protein CUT44_04000 [Streptomyces carminius]|uniref:Uncharacterized protein n=1 Tax=Streptomyces carminius TaxID=2665496 RepID=A0A2M8M643_9ACTN|nr:hypothetical protein [Streptomyces carminius]PJE99669.1 hypothetical protein CUT44_04000 [Streptomyces carminius]
MTRRTPHPPPTGGHLPHLPAEVYRQLGDRPVVIIHAPAPRRPAAAYAVPLAIGLAAGFGFIGLVAAGIALFEFAARTAALLGTLAGPIGIGTFFQLARPKHK